MRRIVHKCKDAADRTYVRFLVEVARQLNGPRWHASFQNRIKKKKKKNFLFLWVGLWSLVFDCVCGLGF